MSRIRLLATFVFPVFFCLALFAQPDAPASAPAGQKKDLLWQKLEQTIRDADHDLDGVLAVSVRDLTDGRQFDYHADEVMATASTIKIAVLAELYHQQQQSAAGQSGKARLNDLYTVNAADLVPDSAILGGLTPGTARITLHDVATMMIAVSDNSATNVLIDRLGMDNVNALLASQGLKDTRLRRKMMDLPAAQAGRENIATTRELTAFLDALWHGRVLGGASANPAGSSADAPQRTSANLTDDFFSMLGTLKDSPFRRGLPDSVRSADKPGELEGVRNDCGVIYATRRPFVLCVMTGYDAHERKAVEIIGHIAYEAWQTFDRIGRASDYGRVISPGNSTEPR